MARANLRRAFGATVLAVAAIVASTGAARACELALVLAVDVSGSIDQPEFSLQLEGVAGAFESQALADVADAIQGGFYVTMTQWSGATRQAQVTGWHHVASAADAEAYARTVRAAGRVWRNFSTAIGEALVHAGQVMDDLPAPCRRRVIDVSGDGISNEGRAPAEIARALAASGLTINGLVIQTGDPEPVRHYRDEVIAGDGAFLEIAVGFADFPRAFLRKLLREVEAPDALSAAPLSGPGLR